MPDRRCWAHVRNPDGSVGHCEGPPDHWGDCSAIWDRPSPFDRATAPAPVTT